MIPQLENGVVLHINENILSSHMVSDLLRSRSLSIYTDWEFEKAWIDSRQLMSIRIDDNWYWLTQFGWVGTDQLEDVVYSVE